MCHQQRYRDKLTHLNHYIYGRTKQEQKQNQIITIKTIKINEQQHIKALKRIAEVPVVLISHLEQVRQAVLLKVVVFLVRPTRGHHRLLPKHHRVRLLVQEVDDVTCRKNQTS